MPAKKKPRPAEPTAVETDEGVEILYPGRVLQPALAPLRRARCCEACGEGPVASAQRYGTTKTNYLYECPKCTDPRTCRPTRWQEPR